MASRRTDQQLAFAASIFGHAAIVAALTFSIPLSRTQLPAGEIVVPIETVMINEAAIEAEIARIEAAEEAERMRQQQEAERILREQEDARIELERIEREAREAAAAAEREIERIAEQERVERERLLILEQERQEAERIAEQERIERERQAELERQAEIERQRLEEERRRQEQERLAAERAAEEARLRREAEERARREAVEAEIARAIAAEQEARAARDAGLRDQWSRAISDHVERRWNRPPNVSSELRCVLVVEQLPNGDVINTTVDECNTTDGNIIRSIENAVLNASPLPPAPRGVAFERVLRITFSPDD